MKRDARVYVAGHRGLVGSALIRQLEAQGYVNLVTRSRTELDLTDPAAVKAFFQRERPEYVFLAAARVGGIWANQSYPAEFIYTNLAIETSVIHSAYLAGVKRLIFFGSNCVYPQQCPQPMKEEYLLTDRLESTSEPYAVAKIAGMKMCEAYNRQYGTCFLSLIPPTVFGPNDSFDADTSHVLSALVRKCHEANQVDGDRVVIWGSGNQRREFIYVDDLARACVFVMNLEDGSLQSAAQECGWVLNAGTGDDLTIRELASVIQHVVGFEREIEPDLSRPDGAPRKLLDSSRLLRLGWSPKVSLREGIERTYEWYLSTQKALGHGVR